MFGPEASGRLNDWLGLNLNTPTGDPLNSSMGTSLGNLELELKPLLGDLTPFGPAAAAGTSPWAEMSDSAIGTLGSMEILIKGLNPGQYALTSILAIVLLTKRRSYTYNMLPKRVLPLHLAKR